MVHAGISGTCRAKTRCVSPLTAGAFLVSVAAAVSAQPMQVAELADLSIEELGNIQVTSVSKHGERLSDAPASIYVITGEDIRRAGATSLTQALRLAPNLEVAQVNANQFAISARGFNGTIANKLLVLIDGRSVYTPLFSGVFWDVQDVVLEDIDRIEVISGPGATLWGANAVNGVINVITKRSSDTQGTLASARFGDTGRGYNLRYGGALGESGGTYRAYGKLFDVFNTQTASGATASDAWSKGQVGFRTDWGSASNGFTFQGDAYRGSVDEANLGDGYITGSNLLARLNRELSGGGRLEVQGYYDRTTRGAPSTFDEKLETYDIEFQHGLRALDTHSVTWGGGYRAAFDHATSNPTFALVFLPPDRRLRWGNVFVQDEIAIAKEWRLTIGAKVENNYYSGTDFLPSIRLAWKPEPQQLLWGAVSRATRAPSRLDRELFSPNQPQPPFVLQGGPDFASEIADVFELGYRAQPSAQATYSITLSHGIYDKLRSVEPVPGGIVIGNKMEGTIDALEAWGTYQPTRNWRLSAGGFLLKERLSFEPDSGDTNLAAAGNDPAHQLVLRSSLDLPDRSQLDIIVRNVGALPNPSVPSYTTMDVRYARLLRRDLELSVVGQNLLDAPHAEFIATGSSMVARGAYVKLKWTP